jgi:hypothetical protein
MKCRIGIGEKMSAEKKFILLSFLLVYMMILTYSLLTQQESVFLQIIRVVVFVTYLLLIFLAYKEKFVATLIMAIMIIVTGLHSLVIGSLTGYNQVVL